MRVSSLNWITRALPEPVIATYIGAPPDGKLHEYYTPE